MRYRVRQSGLWLGTPGSLTTCSFLPLVVVWAQDICLKMAFMKSVVQVANAIRNIADLEDFQFAQKPTLTAILVVSRVALPRPREVLGSNSADWLAP